MLVFVLALFLAACAGDGTGNGTPTPTPTPTPSVDPAAPTAADVSITGMARQLATLTGTYTYNDVNADAEGTSTFRWFLDDIEISGETGQTYSVLAMDKDSLIKFEVTPVSATGSPSTGDPVVSAAVGPIDDPLAQILATKDNTIFEDVGGNLSNGAGVYFYVGQTNITTPNLTRRALIRFDIAGNIAAGSTILDATLNLQMSRTQAAAENISLHELTTDWGEGTSNSNVDGGGGGVAPIGVDATWTNAFDNGASWTSNGADGDYDVSASATTSVGGTGIYTFNAAPMVIDVQNWLDSGGNFGWILINGDEISAQTAKRFNSRENGSNPPRLDVEYSLP